MIGSGLRVLTIVLVATLPSVVGCVERSANHGEPTVAASAPISTDAMAPNASRPLPEDRAPVMHTMEWGGSLPYGAWACDDAVTNACKSQPAEAFGVSKRFRDLAGRMTEGSLTLTWNTQSPLTTDLGMGVSIRTPGCAQCPRTSWGKDISGPSPLTINVPSGGVVLTRDAVVEIWVYGGIGNGVGPLAAGVSGEQAFRMSGSVAVIPDAK